MSCIINNRLFISHTFIIGSAAVQNRQFCELVPRCSTRVHQRRHTEISWELCKKHETF